MPLTPEDIERFKQEYIENKKTLGNKVDELLDALNSPVQKRIESRLGEMFSAPKDEQQKILDNIVAEENARESTQDNDL